VSPPRPAHSFRPRVECLEDRTTPNVNPVFAPSVNRFISPGQPFYAQEFATDADNQWLTYGSNLPAGLTINPTTGTVTGTLPVGQYQAGQNLPIAFTAADGSGGLATQMVEYFVTAAPQVWTVNTLADTNDVNPVVGGNPIDGQGKVSLRAALQQANTNRTQGTTPIYINFDMTALGQQANGATPNIVLGLGALPAVTADVTILGPGAGSLTVTGQGNQGVFTVGVKGQGTLPLAAVVTGLTIQGGTNRTDLPQGGTGDGGAVQNYWNAFLVGVTITNGSANMGGGVYSVGSLTINNSQVLQNKTVVVGMVGDGGGVDVNGGQATIAGSTIQSNTAGLRGGGIGLQMTGQALVMNTTVTGNSAQNGGGVYSSGGTWFQMTGGTVTLNMATAGNGGGVLGETNTMLLSVTFDSNTASLNGGAINVANTLVLTNCTFGTKNQAANGPKVAAQQGLKLTQTGNVNFDPLKDIFYYGA
jgi:predicted outer membrane repeat protein